MTQDQQITIHHDDCLTALRAMPDASVSAIVTDPPYGLSNTDPTSVADTITKWATGDREHVPTGRGFMGKAWDAFVPPPAVWDECLRVLKPGGHMVVFAGSRTQDLMGLSIRLAGFDIRDSVAWLYGSGFPKSMDVSKAIDKGCGAERIVTQQARADLRPGRHITFDQRSSKDRERRDVPATDAAREWEGWGTALKPAHEPVIVARKPLAGTVAGNVQEHGTGALNIDACRVGTETVGWGGKGAGGQTWNNENNGLGKNGAPRPVQGRWPANVVLDESQAAELDRQAPATGGSGKASGPSLRDKTAAGVAFGARNGLDGEPAFYGDKGGASRFFYVTGREGGTVGPCDPANTAAPSSSQPSDPVDTAPGGAATSDSHGGPSMSPGSSAPSTSATPTGSRLSDASSTPTILPTGSASSPAWQPAAPSPSSSPASSVASPESATMRTTSSPSSSSGTADDTTSSGTSSFTVPGAQGFPGDELDARFKYTAKASKSERPVVDGTAHPTVKPLAIMRWLIRLTTPPGGVVLDPFAGSGTTIEAAILEGFPVTGIEREADYLPLIQARIDRATVPAPETEPSLFDGDIA